MAFHGWIVRFHGLSYPALCVICHFGCLSTLFPDASLFFSLSWLWVSVFPVRSVCFECGFFHLSKRASEVDLCLFSLTTVEGRDLEIKMNAVCCGLHWFVQEWMWASRLREMWTIYFAAAGVGTQAPTDAIRLGFLSSRAENGFHQVGKSCLPGSPEKPVLIVTLWVLAFLTPPFTVWKICQFPANAKVCHLKQYWNSANNLSEIHLMLLTLPPVS